MSLTVLYLILHCKKSSGDFTLQQDTVSAVFLQALQLCRQHSEALTGIHPWFISLGMKVADCYCTLPLHSGQPIPSSHGDRGDGKCRPRFIKSLSGQDKTIYHFLCKCTYKSVVKSTWRMCHILLSYIIPWMSNVLLSNISICSHKDFSCACCSIYRKYTYYNACVLCLLFTAQKCVEQCNLAGNTACTCRDEI